ncbi:MULTISPECIES: hypothetical protein [unclassified Burkholderia]|uniref:hypothetical protein n=1 Tax=unclassified Burkholderia TaxID=2613784 RepID=UPI002AB0F6BB|nr:MULTISPECIES: hypothetical protein [unclassified Burkholderia]
MIDVQEKPSAALELKLALPAGTNPAVVLSLKQSFEEALLILLEDFSFERSLVLRADEIASIVTRLSAPTIPLIEERIQRQKTMREILAHGEWLTAEQVNELQAAPPANKSQPTNDWKRRGRIYSVSLDGKDYFAAYQFDEMCQPLPVIKSILAALGEVSDTWRIAAWFHFPNGWITGTGAHTGQAMAPKDALDRHDAVVGAARHLSGASYVA